VPNSAFSGPAGIVFRFREALIRARSRLFALWTRAVVTADALDSRAKLKANTGATVGVAIGVGLFSTLPRPPLPTSHISVNAFAHLRVFRKYERLHVTRSPLEITGSQ
jgi:hypothetical protein